MGNIVIKIMLRRVGRIWECKAICTRHDVSKMAAGIDNRAKVLIEAIAGLTCGCGKDGAE